MSSPRNPYTAENRAEANYYKLGGYSFFTMKRYLSDMISLMQSQRFKLQESHREELERFPMNPQMIDNAYENRYRDLDVDFARILLNSSFIASFSIFEIMFKEVCHFAAYKFSRKFESDFNTGIDKCRSYLVRDLKIDISDKRILGNHISIVGDYIVTTKLEKGIEKQIDDIFSEKDNEKDIHEGLEKILSKKQKVKLSIERNKEKAKKFRKKISENFYVPQELIKKYDLY